MTASETGHLGLPFLCGGFGPFMFAANITVRLWYVFKKLGYFETAKQFDLD